MTSKNFALVGAAGYVAPRHLQAIRNTGNQLVAALDKSDSVGILDAHFPQAAFFTEFERFDRHLEKLKRGGHGADFISICSPNYLHDAHCRYGLRYGADVICEKPLVLNPWNADALLEMEAETGKRVYTILQLRLHPAILELRDFVAKNFSGEKMEVELTYVTARGPWYFASWKGETAKSGGIATNIGIHFFDMLLWVFGPLVHSETHLRTHDREAGFLELEKARVRWFLSISEDTLPVSVREKGGRTHRVLTIGGREWQFSEGFADLHTLSYQKILAGEGFGVGDSLAGISLAHQIRTAALSVSGEKPHDWAGLPLGKHPFLEAPHP